MNGRDGFSKSKRANRHDSSAQAGGSQEPDEPSQLGVGPFHAGRGVHAFEDLAGFFFQKLPFRAGEFRFDHQIGPFVIRAASVLYVNNLSVDSSYHVFHPRLF